MGHRYPPRGLKGAAVIIGSRAWPKHTLVGQNGLAIPGVLLRGGSLPEVLLVHIKAPGVEGEALAEPLLGSGRRNNLFAENGVRIFAIGKQSVVRSEQRRSRTGGKLQNGFESPADRRVAQAEMAVANDQKTAGL